jgi:hypothetical protein
MSFFSKIMENKAVVAVTTGAAILGGALLWYKSFYPGLTGSMNMNKRSKLKLQLVQSEL